MAAYVPRLPELLAVPPAQLWYAIQLPSTVCFGIQPQEKVGFFRFCRGSRCWGSKRPPIRKAQVIYGKSVAPWHERADQAKFGA